LTQFKNFFPPPDALLEMETEEIASFLLDYLCSDQETKGLNFVSHSGFHLNNFVSGGSIIPYARDYNFDVDKIGRAISEAWCWLRREIMLAPLPSSMTGSM